MTKPLMPPVYSKAKDKYYVYFQTEASSKRVYYDTYEEALRASLIHYVPLETLSAVIPFAKTRAEQKLISFRAKRYHTKSSGKVIEKRGR